LTKTSNKSVKTYSLITP